MLFVDILGFTVVLVIAVATWRRRSSQKGPETFRVVPPSDTQRK
jgi:hypothetical protein